MRRGRRARVPPPIWYGPDLGAQPRGQGKGPQIADTDGDLWKTNKKNQTSQKQAKTNKISPTGGPRPQGGRGRGPPPATKNSKQHKHQQNQPHKGPTTTEGGEGEAPTSPENHQKTNKMSNISTTRGSRPQRRRGPCPHQPRKPSKNNPNEQHQPHEGPTTTEGARAMPPTSPENHQKTIKKQAK